VWGGIPLSKVRTTGRGGGKFKVRDQDLENPTRKVTTWRDGAAIPCPKLGQGRSRAGQQRSGEIDAAQARGEVGTCVPPPWPRPSSPRRQGTASIWMMRAALSQTIVPDRSSSAMAELNFVLAASSPCRGSGSEPSIQAAMAVLIRDVPAWRMARRSHSVCLGLPPTIGSLSRPQPESAPAMSEATERGCMNLIRVIRNVSYAVGMKCTRCQRSRVS
jgi:hypothetical protein